MTQVKEMTNLELDLALAELMGKKTPGGKLGHFLLSDFSTWYCTDPAASLEVQTAAMKVSAEYYVMNLVDIVAPNSPNDWEIATVIALLRASPRERAEAAYQTLCGEQ